MNSLDPKLLAALDQDTGFARFLASLSPGPTGGQPDPMALDWRSRPQSSNIIDLRGSTGPGGLMESPYGPGTMMASGLMPPAPMPPGQSIINAAAGDDGSGVVGSILRELGFNNADLPRSPHGEIATLPTVRVEPSTRQRRRLDPNEFDEQGVPHAARYNFGDNRVYRNRSGNFVVDSTNRGKDGKVPTHRIDLLPPEVRRGQVSIQDFERSVLAKPASEFGPAARQTTNTLDALDAAVRPNMERMIAAARRAGFEVYVNETRRPQERQEWLFQQGRSRPGPIVTWTLTSDHRDGRAADLRFNSDAGYRWMWANAGRFGLYTLGASDPGHVGMQSTPAQRRGGQPAPQAQAPAQRPGRGPFRIQGNMSDAAAQRSSTGITPPARRPAPARTSSPHERRQRNP